MEGPKAPKDPEKELPGFYIVREKEIFGTEQPDKRGGHFLYENDGRLINSAQISGNITDERILEALKTAEGFRNLVKRSEERRVGKECGWSWCPERGKKQIGERNASS